MILFDDYLLPADFEKIVRNTTNFDANFLVPHVQEAAEKYLYPELTQAVVAKFVDGTIADPAAQQYVKQALVYFAAAINVNYGSVNTTPTGFQEHVNDNQKPIRLEVLDIYQQSLLDSGFQKVELLLEYMETSTTTDFDDWKASEAYTVRSLPYISSVKEFQKYVNINGSRRLYRAIIPSLEQCLVMYINPFVAINTAIVVTGIEQAVIDQHLKRALANYAYAYAVEGLAVSFGYDTVLGFDNTFASRQKGGKTANETLVKSLFNRRMEIANTAMAQAQTYLNSLIPPLAEPLPADFQNKEKSQTYFTGLNF